MGCMNTRRIVSLQPRAAILCGKQSIHARIDTDTDTDGAAYAAKEGRRIKATNIVARGHPTSMCLAKYGSDMHRVKQSE